MITFSTLNFFWFAFLQFFFLTRSNDFFTTKITNNICPRRSFFNFFNHENFLRPIWSVIFCKNIVIFSYSYMLTNRTFRVFIFVFYTKINISARLYINRLHSDCTTICIVVFINYFI